MGVYSVKKESLSTIADAIREKTGVSGELSLDGMAAAIPEVYEAGENAERNRKIGTADEFIAFMNDPARWSDSVTLIADIDLTDKAQTPIGNLNAPFTGTFDGGGHTISGINIIGYKSCIGLFGAVAGAKIHDLTIRGKVKNNYVDYGTYATGGLIGLATGDVTIKNIVNYCNVNGTIRTGGICGTLRDTDTSTVVSGCANYGNVESSRYCIGGIVAWVEGDNIVVSECLNAGVVGNDGYNEYGGNYNGGIVGYITGAQKQGSVTVKNCMHSGTVATNDNRTVGGIVGITRNNAGAVFENLYVCGTVENTTGNFIRAVVGVSEGENWFTNCFYLPYLPYDLNGSSTFDGFNRLLKDDTWVDSNSCGVELKAFKSQTPSEKKCYSALEYFLPGEGIDHIDIPIDFFPDHISLFNRENVDSNTQIMQDICFLPTTEQYCGLTVCKYTHTVSVVMEFNYYRSAAGEAYNLLSKTEAGYRISAGEKESNVLKYEGKYLVVAEKLSEKSDKYMLAEYVCSLPDTAVTVYASYAMVYGAFTVTEWKTLIAEKPNVTFVLN